MVSSNSIPNEWWIFGLKWKVTLDILNYCGHILANVWKNFGILFNSASGHFAVLGGIKWQTAFFPVDIMWLKYLRQNEVRYCIGNHRRSLDIGSEIVTIGRGGGQGVSVFAIYSVDLSSNPAELYNFSVKLYLKRTKINKKVFDGAHLIPNLLLLPFWEDVQKQSPL